jgi:hypothetical protein
MVYTVKGEVNPGTWEDVDLSSMTPGDFIEKYINSSFNLPYLIQLRDEIHGGDWDDFEQVLYDRRGPVDNEQPRNLDMIQDLDDILYDIGEDRLQAIVRVGNIAERKGKSRLEADIERIKLLRAVEEFYGITLTCKDNKAGYKKNSDTS